MRFTTASACESVVWQMRLSDFPRATNRAKLNDLYNGFPPFEPRDTDANRCNTNFLEGTKILHDARRQFATAFQGGEQLFNVTLDYGPVWKRREWSARITRELNKIIRGSRRYADCLDSIFALNVLHGIGPSMWEDKERWCPYELGVEDVLVPSNTYVSLRNLPFFAVFRQYTGAELWRLTHGPKRDPAWNMNLVDRAITWVDQQAQQLMSASWPEVWSPEKMSERIKQDGGLYASDAVPTIDTFDVYFWNDNGKKSGWNRRIILDAWGSPGVGGAGGIATPASPNSQLPEKTFLGTRNEFLYNAGDRIYANNLEQIIHFQFADASAVAPFRYHSVRSLGFLLYSVCHLQNRLRCRFNDHTFENLLQYFRVSNPADAERLSSVDLVDKGIVPEGLMFVNENERWQINQSVVEQAFEMNRQTLADNSASFTQDFDTGEKPDETATRTMAKVNATAALVTSMLNRAYNQQEHQYREICRRFGMENSKDPDVREFWKNCLRDGLPKEALDPCCWEVKAVRVIGSGNKMLQAAMAQKLWAMRPVLDPEAQRLVDRIYVLANTDDPALPEQIVPEKQHISSSVHDAQNGVGTLLAGQPISIESGMNHEEYIKVWLGAMAKMVAGIQQRGGVATPQELTGLQNLAQHIGQHIQLMAQDKTAKAKVKVFGDDLKQLMNYVKAFGQRLAEQQQKAQQQNGNGMDPKAMAQLRGKMMIDQAKAANLRESHAQKTAQRRLQFEQQMQEDAQRHMLELHKDAQKHAADMQQSQMRSLQE